MDPISAVIGGAGSLIGSFMNTSSQQAINARNLQFQTQQAQGQFLPSYAENLVNAGNASGISPLVLAGVHPTISPGTAVGTAPGQGVSEAGRYLSQIKDAHTVRMEQLAEKLGVSQIDRVNAETSQTQLDSAKTMYVLEALREGGAALNNAAGSLSSMGQGVHDYLSSWKDWFARPTPMSDRSAGFGVFGVPSPAR